MALRKLLTGDFQSLTDLLRDLDRMKATLTADLENQTRQLRVTDVALKASVYDMDELSLSLAAGVASAVSNLEQAVQRSSVSLSRSLLEAQSSVSSVHRHPRLADVASAGGTARARATICF